MKNQDLLLALNELDDAIVLDAAETARPVRRHPKALSLLLAAALAAALVGCAYALTEADWFQSFFREHTQQSLTSGQAEYIDQRTEDLGQSVTRNGYTLTVESAIADQYTAFVKLKLQAPSGKILDAESYLPGVPDPRNPVKSLSRADGKHVAFTSSIFPLEDADPRDGTFSIMEVIRLQSHTEVTFDEEGVWNLHYQNFDACYEDENRGFQTIMEGSIDFEIVFTKISTEEISIIPEPLPYTFQLAPMDSAYVEGTENRVDGFITSLTLRTMSATMTVEGGNVAVGFLEIPIVMKDGSQVKMQASGFGTGTYNYSLQIPIDLQEVDHILLENGTKLYLPG